MPHTYPIFEVHAAYHDPETRGSKSKFWLTHGELGRCLFKFARPGTGEDWAEKIAEQAARRLGLPCARYELARLDSEGESHPGVLSVDFLAPREAFVPGHGLLMEHIPRYPEPAALPRFDSTIRAYTLEATVRAIGASGMYGAQPEQDAPRPALDVFVGYLLLDAWIANQDRHHENWGIVERTPSDPSLGVERLLAPTFDHASSLGRLMPEARMAQRLTTRDRGYGVEAYCQRASTPFFAADGARRLTTHEAFREAAAFAPEAAQRFVLILEAVQMDECLQWVESVPAARLSTVARKFVSAMLVSNRKLLLHGSPG